MFDVSGVSASDGNELMFCVGDNCDRMGDGQGDGK